MTALWAQVKQINATVVGGFGFGLRVRLWWGLAAGALSGVKPIAKRRSRVMFTLRSRAVHKNGQWDLHNLPVAEAIVAV
jgi:hypothetical protein